MSKTIWVPKSNLVIIHALRLLDECTFRKANEGPCGQRQGEQTGARGRQADDEVQEGQQWWQSTWKASV